MDIEQIVQAIDDEILRLQHAKALLAGDVPRNGFETGFEHRHKAKAAKRPLVSPLSLPRKKRTMSAEGRARIAAAQKARWAKTHGKH